MVATKVVIWPTERVCEHFQVVDRGGCTPIFSLRSPAIRSSTSLSNRTGDLEHRQEGRSSNGTLPSLLIVLK